MHRCSSAAPSRLSITIETSGPCSTVDVNPRRAVGRTRARRPGRPGAARSTTVRARPGRGRHERSGSGRIPGYASPLRPSCTPIVAGFPRGAGASSPGSPGPSSGSPGCAPARPEEFLALLRETPDRRHFSRWRSTSRRSSSTSDGRPARSIPGSPSGALWRSVNGQALHDRVCVCNEASARGVAGQRKEATGRPGISNGRIAEPMLRLGTVPRRGQIAGRPA